MSSRPAASEPASAQPASAEPASSERPIDGDPLWEAFLRAPVVAETPEQRAAYEAAREAAREGVFVGGAEVTADIARRRYEWPGDAGK